MGETKKRVLVIDKQEYWRELSTKTLVEAGFAVEPMAEYDYEPGTIKEPFDLIILGCASIDVDEQRLIAKILESGHHLLVLSTSLPWRVMRSLFLAGADDVANKPYDPDRLTSIVQQAFETIAPRNSYSVTKHRGTT